MIIIFSWETEPVYTRPDGDAIQFLWETAFTQTFFSPSASEGSTVPSPSVDGYNYILPAGLEHPEGWSDEEGDMWIRRADPQTIYATVGEATTWEWARVVFPCVPRPDGFIRFDFTYRVRPLAPPGIDYSAFGRLSLRNWDSIIEPVGVDSFGSLHSRIYDAAHPPLWFDLQPSRQPNAQNIYFYWGFTRDYIPPGIDSLEFGATVLTPGAVYIVCGDGDDDPETEFGTADMEAYLPPPQERSPLGIDSLEIDEPYIWTWLQYMEQQTGPPFTEWGENPTVVITDQFLYPYEIEPPLLEENTLIENWVRYIVPRHQEPYTEFGIPITTKIDPPVDQFIDLNGYGFWDPKGGLPHISHYVQFATPVGVAPITNQVSYPAIFTRQFLDLDWFGWTNTEFGPRTAVIREYVLAPVTIRSKFFFGTATFDFGNWAGPPGINSVEFGKPELTRTRFTQHLRTFAEDTLPIGHDTRIFNSDQYITTEYDVERDKPIGWIGEQNINNRNRNVRMSGAFFQRFATWPLRIYLNARLLAPKGIAPASEIGRYTTLTHYVQYILTNGRDSLWFPFFYPAIYNAAQACYPEGFSSFRSDNGSRFLNTRRWFQHYFPFSGNEFGRAFIADAVRTIYVDAYQFFDQKTVVGTPAIALWTQYIRPVGKYSAAYGYMVEDLGPFKRGFRTFGITHSEYGRPRLVNRNRAYSPYGIAAPSASLSHRISHDPQYAHPVGIFNNNQFTRNTWIRDSKQILNLARGGIDSYTSWPFTRVRNFPIPIDPAPIPTIDPTGHKNPGRCPDNPAGDGEQWREQFGEPTIQGSRKHIDGFDSLEMGSPNCLGHSIRVRQYFGSLEFGRPRTNSTQIIDQAHFPPRPDDWMITEWGYFAHRVSPHTIWCWEDTPAQATQNHPGGGAYRHINFSHYGYGNEEVHYPLFGPVTVTLANRSVQPHSYSVDSEFGAHSVWLGAQFIVMEEGIKSLRVTIPVLVPRTLRVRQKNDYPATYIGGPSLRNDPEVIPTTRYLYAEGIDSFSCTDNSIELKNRPLPVDGKEHTFWGDNEPMVHYPRGCITEGSEFLLWGNKTFIAYRIRHFQFVGNSMTLMLWVTFNDRMKVTYENGRWGTGWKWLRNVSIGDTLTVSSTYASGGVATIYAYMIPPIAIKSGTEIRHA